MPVLFKNAEGISLGGYNIYFLKGSGDFLRYTGRIFADNYFYA